MDIRTLIGKQNADGGWPYARGKSWIEPTVYAVLALLAAGELDTATRGIRWIAGLQRRDGGWPPQAGVDESTWVTTLCAMLPPELLGPVAHRRAIDWLMGTTGQESTATYRVREWLLGNRRPPDQKFAGWPWVPGAAAWVGPTSLAILALERQNGTRPSPAIQQRIEEGRGFLLARMCQGGGWNHGSARALGYESRPYPETTGMALAALRGSRRPEVQKAVAVARTFLCDCRSADALNWLRLGLLAQEQLPAGFGPPAAISYRTIPEASLGYLVAEAMSGRSSTFWA